MNIELLKKVATKLRRMRHKEHFEMRVYATQTSCGTAACVAGHALLMSGYKVIDRDSFISPLSNRSVSPFNAGRKVLGLTGAQANRLFEASNWPQAFGGLGDVDWDEADKCESDYPHSDSRRYNDPKVAAARIDHFIATKGKE